MFCSRSCDLCQYIKNSFSLHFLSLSILCFCEFFYFMFYIVYSEIFDPLGFLVFSRKRHGSTCSLLHTDIQLDQHQLLEMLSLSIMYFWILYLKNWMFIDIWVICLIPLLIFLVLCHYYVVVIPTAVWYSMNRHCDTCVYVPLLYNIVLVILDFFYFPFEVEYWLSMPVKMC